MKSDHSKSASSLDSKNLRDVVKKIVTISSRLRNLINFEFKPQAREFFMSNRFFFGEEDSDEEDEESGDFVNKLESDIEYYQDLLKSL